MEKKAEKKRPAVKTIKISDETHTLLSKTAKKYGYVIEHLARRAIEKECARIAVVNDRM